MLSKDYLLTTDIARDLYHGVAKSLPIIDFHCHLNASVFAENMPFKSIADLWVVGDPYKHRIMRIYGIEERRITGDASGLDKFLAWSEVMPKTLGNPLFDWSCMELKNVFGVDELLTQETAKSIWAHCNTKLAQDDFLPLALLKKFGVEQVCTSNAASEDLTVYREIDKDNLGFEIIPSPRDAVAADIVKFADFHALGCRIADHSVEDAEDLQGLLPLAREYAARGWVMQLHLGAERYTNSRLRKKLGPAGGYATMGMSFDTRKLIDFLDQLDQEGFLPNTLVFPLNPIDTASLTTLTGSFAPQVQIGPAWWYNDHRKGMVEHLELISVYGLLRKFIGMTTDSRSILSMVRHEYFRRILCSWVGEQVQKDLMTKNYSLLEDLIRGVCYTNASELFIKEN